MKRKIERILVPLSALALLFYGCRSQAPIQESSPNTPTPTQPAITSPPTEPTARPPIPPTLSPRPKDSAVPPVELKHSSSMVFCSPLEGIPVDKLGQPDLLKNPFAPPRPGYDDGHFGIDLAYWADADGKPMQGLPVHAIQSGTVVGVIENRQPYGYALIIETQIDHFPPELIRQLEIPPPRHDLQPALALSCPDYKFAFGDHMTSIYTLYAHFDQPPLVKQGTQVDCGEPIGAVGSTGRSVNPHLHLETRHGPAGMTFASIAHYDNSATQEEMRLYCLWRISGAFAPFDPLLLFEDR